MAMRHEKCTKTQQDDCATGREQDCDEQEEDMRRKAANTGSFFGQRYCTSKSGLWPLVTTRVLSLWLLAATTPLALAQQQTCVRLAGSTTCPGFNGSSISASLTNIFPFVSNVTDVRSFDDQLAQYVNTTYAQQKYQNQDFFGCSNVNLSNTTDLYARYTYSFICNALIQNSISPCGLTPAQSPPLCADSCSDFAQSEENIISSPQLCGSTGANAVNQLRADFTHCVQPQDSLNTTCVHGYQNEPDECGFRGNLIGLCSYCSTSTVNSTDYCCVTSRTEERCSNVRLPVYSSMQPLFTTPASASTASATAAAATSGGSGLSGGQIAGIVVGSVAGAAILLGLLICCLLLTRRRRSARDAKSSLNQPTPPQSREKAGRASSVTGGARVTRMAALEHDSGNSPEGQAGTAPELSQQRGVGVAGVIGKRGKSDPEGVDESSPESGGYSSGEGGTGQSEQLDAFKDYYSNDDIHPVDLVSTLWAYSPRAGDEFELERGDMLKIVGIWDDGWATGIRVDQRASQWEPEHNSQRDSGMSGSSNQETVPKNGDVKAFPLVCVCLPQHWRKTIEGDATEPDFSSDGPTTDRE